MIFNSSYIRVYSYFLSERGSAQVRMGEGGGGGDCLPSQGKVKGCKVEVLLEYSWGFERE